jgi:hypothetical protein
VSEQQQGSARDPLRRHAHYRHVVSSAVILAWVFLNHTLTEKLTVLTEQVHEVTCGRPSMS